jgi:hypothetical protein
MSHTVHVEPMSVAPVQVTATHPEPAHPAPTEDKVTRVVFLIIMGFSALFIAATIFLSHM